MNIPDMSQVDLTLVLGWVSAFAAVAAAVGAISSAVIARKVYLSQTSPDVIVFMDGSLNESDAATLYVRNIGNAPAYDVSIVIDPELPCDEIAKEAVETGFLSSGIPFLQPGGERKVFLDMFDDQIRKMGETAFEARATCFSAPSRRGRKIEGIYPISGSSFIGDTGDDPKGIVHMGSIALSLDKIAKAMK